MNLLLELSYSLDPTTAPWPVVLFMLCAAGYLLVHGFRIVTR
jgi:lipopolysaccharide export LptBFGC system permease protein LptF